MKKGITFERYKKILCISRGFSLINKKAGNPTEFIRLRELLDKRYTCVQISNSEYFQFSFKSGHSIEVIFKSLKWLFKNSKNSLQVELRHHYQERRLISAYHPGRIVSTG